MNYVIFDAAIATCIAAIAIPFSVESQYLLVRYFACRCSVHVRVRFSLLPQLMQFDFVEFLFLSVFVFCPFAQLFPIVTSSSTRATRTSSCGHAPYARAHSRPMRWTSMWPSARKCATRSAHRSIRFGSDEVEPILKAIHHQIMD